MTSYQLYLHRCIAANHTLKNTFPSDLDPPKSKIFPWPQSWWGLALPMNHRIFFSRVLTLVAIALEKFRSPDLFYSIHYYKEYNCQNVFMVFQLRIGTISFFQVYQSYFCISWPVMPSFLKKSFLSQKSFHRLSECVWFWERNCYYLRKWLCHQENSLF